MRKAILTLAGIAMTLLALSGQTHYVGGDISLLPEYEKAGAIYKDYNGKTITDLLPWLKQQGMNAMRVRLFVNPAKYRELHSGDANSATRYDANACQDLAYIKPLCKQIVDNGFDLMLDFHYSDTWADPAKQWTPIDWEGLSDEQLYQKIYDYTKYVLTELKAEGIVPAFIQPGNEISYGMLWGPLGTNNPKKVTSGSEDNWPRFTTLLKQAIKACNEVCPDAKIILHTERVNQIAVQNNFYTKMKEYAVPYDIIGLSYYPYFHGDLTTLSGALGSLQLKFPDKNIMIVETGYSYKWAVPGSTIDNTDKWPLTEVGQNKFAQDLVETIERYTKADGIFWWWMEYNAFNTSLSGWYNAPLFDSTTGKATLALKTICGYATSGVNNVLPDYQDDSQWYCIQGHRIDKPTVPGLYIINGRKVLISH